jgi:hypothetical protein
MAETTGRNKSSGVSKMEGVRQALRQLGRHAKPTQIHDFIKEKFGIEMSKDHISNYKSTILKGKGKKGRKAAAAKAAATKPAATTGNGKGRASLSPEDVDNVKNLLRRHGPDSLRKLIDVLVK